MNRQELFKRYLIFSIGIIINSFGISLITKANLGTSPISSLPFTLSLGFSPTLGTFTLYMSIILIVLQIILLRKNFPKHYFLQIPVSILFSVFIDLSMSFLTFMNPVNFIFQFLFLVLGCLILGFGVYLEMVADVVMLPGEAFVNAVSITFKSDFGKTKVLFDTSMTICAILLSFIIFNHLEGVGIGTVLAAVMVGMVARFLKRQIQFIPNFISQKSHSEPLPQEFSNPGKTIITISREYGSDGRKIGKALSELLAYDYYDKEIIEMTAQNFNLPEAEVAANEEMMHNPLLNDLLASYNELEKDATLLDKLYQAETEIIQKAADKGNCIIIGRSADYILRNYNNCINIFIYASDTYKISNIMNRENLSRLAAQKHMRTINKRRFIHYKYYTGQIFGLSKNYHLSLDISKLGFEKTLQLIEDYLSITKSQEIKLSA
ncbi:cytidylate kinase family protein [Eubacteriaceae bacterium ES3]|nr:cytidylate kinase family protein [Eubacteriaceae bacterium ES3]